MSMKLHSAGPFTTRLWQSNTELVSRIVAHPFNRGLGTGALPADAFRDYLEQDSLYLIEDTRALENAAQKAPSASERALLLGLARSNVEVELELHALLDRDFPRRPQVKANPATQAYSAFLLDKAESSYAEAVAALLPCFWVYQVVGLRTAEHALPDNPYQAWLDTYSSPESTAATQSFIDLVEAVAHRASDDIQAQMETAFQDGTSHELAFLGGTWSNN